MSVAGRREIMTRTMTVTVRVGRMDRTTTGQRQRPLIVAVAPVPVAAPPAVAHHRPGGMVVRTILRTV